MRLGELRLPDFVFEVKVEKDGGGWTSVPGVVMYDYSLSCQVFDEKINTTVMYVWYIGSKAAASRLI